MRRQAQARKDQSSTRCADAFGQPATTRRANHLGDLSTPLSSPFCKNILVFRNGKSVLCRAIPVQTEGRCATSRNAERDAVAAGRAGDESAFLRTAKSYGPDASTLASSLREAISASDGGKKADRRGGYDISRKAIARGMPGDFRCDLTNACAHLTTHCTRGYRAHRAPGIPCALFPKRAERAGQDSRDTCGEIAKVCLQTRAV